LDGLVEAYGVQERRSQRREEKSVTMLAASSAMLMAKALMTQLSSMRPLSMNRSRRARTRTRTAASAKKEEQRGAAMARRSRRGEDLLEVGAAVPNGTSAMRLVEV
jgi:hypothetical protein